MAAVRSSLVIYMKQLFLIMVFMLGLGCKAQSPIKSLYTDYRELNGAYYKDLDNDLDKFVGTWKYTNGSTSLTITLIKKVMFHNLEGNYYEDTLIGEYKYTVNGVDVINTLNNLNSNYTSQFDYNISGLIIKDQTTQAVGNRRIELCFNDPEREYLNKLIRIKHIDSPGNLPDKIEIKWTGDAIVLPNENSPINLRVPEQDYTLTKQ
jgi:hypothetical protein